MVDILNKSEVSEDDVRQLSALLKGDGEKVIGHGRASLLKKQGYYIDSIKGNELARIMVIPQVLQVLITTKESEFGVEELEFVNTYVALK